MAIEHQPDEHHCWNTAPDRAQAAAKASSCLGSPNGLQHDHRVRDLAMFNLAIDSKLRGCDLVRLRVSDVVLGGTARLRTSII